MGVIFSKCFEMEISFKCILCNEQSSSEPEEPIQLRSAHNEEGGKLFIAIAVCMKRGFVLLYKCFQYSISIMILHAFTFIDPCGIQQR